MAFGSVSRFLGTLSRSVLVVGAAGLTAVLATGCAASGSGAAASPTQAVELAAAHAALANSVTADFSMQGSGQAAITISGSYSEAVRPQLKAEADFPTVSIAGQSVPGGMTEIITSNAAYMRFSELSQLTGGKPWLEVSYSDLDKALGVNFQQLVQQAQNGNPLVQTQMLAGAKDVRVVGTGTIDGVHVTEYSGSYTTSEALRHLSGSLATQFKQQLAKAGITSVGFQVWLDDQQQVRKIIAVDHGSAEDVTVTMLVTSINKPVNVTVPPSSEIASIPLSALTSGN
jgi:hypothetical protein